MTSGVGQVLDRLGRAGLKLSDSYSPSLTEVREYINSGGTYSKGIKIGLQEGETLGPNEAIALAQANVSFTSNTPLDFTGQTGGSLTNASTEAQQVTYFQKLLEKGFLLNNVDADLLNLNSVTVSQDVFELLNSNGFNFSNSKINVTNKMELVSAAVKSQVLRTMALRIFRFQRLWFHLLGRQNCCSERDWVSRCTPVMEQLRI